MHRIPAWALLFHLVFPGGWAAADREPYSAEQLALVRNTSDLRISPDGCTLAFATDITGSVELWTAAACAPGTRNLLTSPAWPEQLSSLRERAANVRFSPDGARILFTSDSGGDERRDIFVARRRGGRVRRLTQTHYSEQDAEFSPSGDRIAYVADAKQPYSFQLYVSDLSTGPARQLTDDPLGVSHPVWSRDGKMIAVTRSGDDRKGDVLIVDAASGKTQAIAAPAADGIIRAKDFSPDGRRLLCTATNGRGFLQLALAPVEGGNIRFFGPADWDVVDARYHPSAGIFYVRNEAGRNALYRMPAPGAAAEKLLAASGRISSFDLDRSGYRLAYLWGDATHPADAWVMDLAKHSRTRLTHSSIGDLEAEDYVKPEWITYSSSGQTISALYYPPRGDMRAAPRGDMRAAPRADSQGLPPAVVFIHGGPNLQVLDEFDPLMQLLAEHGFAVLAPNYRGSTGYGAKFESLNFKDWGGADFGDVQAGADYLIAKRLADPRRLGVMGESYGGYMTLLSLAKSTAVWSAGVECCGMADLAQDFELTKERYGDWYKSEFGTPQTDPELFKARSPSTWLGNWKAPLLIFQGGGDTVVPRSESDRLYARLLEQKVPVGLIVYPNEGHEFSRRWNLTDYYRRTLDFFEKKLPPAAAQQN